MDVSTRDGAAVRVPPPLVFLGALLLGLALPFVAAPARLPLPGALRAILTIALAATGVALLAGAIGLFRRSGQDPRPWESTPEVIGRLRPHPQSDVPRHGGGAAGDRRRYRQRLAVRLAPLALAVVHVTAVRHEEAYLERKFGAEYVAYKHARGAGSGAAARHAAQAPQAKSGRARAGSFGRRCAPRRGRRRRRGR
ncbi:MAG: hypothetical protein U0802_18210 [Candidatus Binatia bacterium]